MIEPRNHYRPRPLIIPDSVVDTLDKLFEQEKAKTLAALEERNAGYFESEFEKLNKWTKDVKHSLEKGLRQLDTDIDDTASAVSRPPV